MGAGQDVQADVEMNLDQVQQAQEDLQMPEDEKVQAEQDWPEWPQEAQMADNIQHEDQLPQHPDVPQDTISFDQSGSTAHYLRAQDPDITVNIEDILQGN